jgi:hypothetical protein
MVEQATTLPFQLGHLDWLLRLLCIPLKRIRYLVPLTLLKCGLTRTPTDGASKMTDARLNLFDGITLSIANSTHHQHLVLALSPTQFWE